MKPFRRGRAPPGPAGPPPPARSTLPRMTRWIRRAAMIAIVAAPLLGSACDPATDTPQASGCKYQQWQGQCVLTNLRTTRTIERPPQTYVVVEETYEPRAGPGEFVPPPFKKEAFAAAAYERLLTDHLATYRTVQCSVLEPGSDPCAPKMAANVPEFLPPPTGAAAGPQGCAKIERTSSTSLSAVPVPLPGPFQFEVGAADLSPESRQ